jgi:hypothetical protein
MWVFFLCLGAFVLLYPDQAFAFLAWLLRKVGEFLAMVARAAARHLPQEPT